MRCSPSSVATRSRTTSATDRDGPLFRGRFHSVDVTTNDQLVTGSVATSTATRSRSCRSSASGGVSMVELRRLPRAPARAAVVDSRRGHGMSSGPSVEAHRAFVETPQTDRCDSTRAHCACWVITCRSTDCSRSSAPSPGVDVGVDHFDARRDESNAGAAGGAHAGDRTPRSRRATRPRRLGSTLATASSVRTIARRGRVAAARDPRLVVAARTCARRAVRPAQPVTKCLTPRDRSQRARSMCRATRDSSCSWWPLARTILGSSARARSWSDASVCLPSRIDWPRSPDQPA